jgi:hypothetical protein
VGDILHDERNNNVIFFLVIPDDILASILTWRLSSGL